MGRLYTSYYSKVKAGRPNTVFVQISNSAPKWFQPHLERLPILYPQWSNVTALHDGRMSKADFLLYYIKKVDASYNGFVASCESIRLWLQDSDVVLLCHEASNKFCHRYSAADMVRDYLKLSYTVEELTT